MKPYISLLLDEKDAHLLIKILGTIEFFHLTEEEKTFIMGTMKRLTNATKENYEVI